MAAVRLQQVRKIYADGHVAVEGATFDVADGELLVLVGPSGCGKSTLLRMIAGLEEISAGTLSIGERVVNDVAPKDRDIAMVFQNYALYPHMSVAENLAFGLKLRGLGKAEVGQRIDAAARMLGLENMLHKLPRELSGGQRQRVALGRALVREPKVFLLDEPLSNLDTQLRHGVRAEIARLHRRLGATMIYVTHDQAEAMALATDVAVMSQGKLLQVAPPAELYAWPEGRLVGSLVGQGAIVTLPVPEGTSRDLDWTGLRAAMESGRQLPQADILVRPQDVVRDAEGIACTVTSVLYEGERYALRLDLPDGQALRAYSREAVAVGDCLPVAIRAAWRL